MRRSFLFATGVAAVLSACSSDAPSGPPAVASVTVTAPAASLVAGAVMALTAQVQDAAGNNLPDRAVEWSSSDTAVAVVGATGVVTGRTPGPVSITARAEGRTGQLSLTVLPVPIAAVQIEAATQLMVVGQTLQLGVVLRDAANNVLAGRPVAWSSSDTARVRVTPAGLLTAVSPGAAGITASSEGRSATLEFTVLLTAPAPVVTGVMPAVPLAGGTITITGQNFDALVANNHVTIRGVAAQVLAASATQLTVRVPCVTPGATALQVARQASVAAPFAVQVTAPVRNPALGEALVVPAGESPCGAIPASATGGRYLVVVFSDATAVNSLIDVRLSGNTPASGSVMVPTLASARTAPARPGTRDAAWIHDSVHLAMLEQERALYEELRARTARDPLAAAALHGVSTPTAVPGLGTMRSLFYNRGGCNDTTNIIRGRAIYVGTRAIIWEDSANVLQSSLTPELAQMYQRLGTIFDQDQYRIVRDNFGDPLRRDPQTDNDGRIHMVFTQRLNGSGAAAYVTSCDQYPRTAAPASNFGEFFYGFVPTSAASNLNSTNNVDGWFTFMARTVVHEVKHIASHAARVANGASVFEQSWLEEGTARHAEELWVRADLHRVPWRGRTGFGTAADNGVFCDFSPANATCNAHDALRRPSYGVRRQFHEIYRKLYEPWAWSPYGTGAGQEGSVFYQTAWSLVRWIVDRYASSEAAFFTALNNAGTNGVTNLSNVAGAPMDRMIGLWGLALYADGYPGLTSVSTDLQFRTWNLRDIYGSLNTHPGYSNTWDRPFPIQPTQLPGGSFSASQQGLRAGSHAYFEIVTTPGEPQLLHLQDLAGGPPPANARIAMTRLQ